MSRVHDALRRAEQMMGAGREAVEASGPWPQATPPSELLPAAGFLDGLDEVPFRPAVDSLLIHHSSPQEPPNEEFRSLRTKLNHLQKLQPLHAVVVTSPSPADGKSFVAANLAIAQAQLSGNHTLLADFDLRRPILHSLFQIPRAPGITDYLLGNAPVAAVIKRVAGMNLCLMPAGSPVKNPLELINLRQTRVLLRELAKIFHWIILDSPPLLFSADANLLGTMADGTILVVRIGQTTIDMVTRAIQSLCENNVLGVVVNGARAGELYSKYTYYSSYAYRDREEGSEASTTATESSESAGDRSGVTDR